MSSSSVLPCICLVLPCICERSPSSGREWCFLSQTYRIPIKRKHLSFLVSVKRKHLPESPSVIIDQGFSWPCQKQNPASQLYFTLNERLPEVSQKRKHYMGKSYMRGSLKKKTLYKMFSKKKTLYEMFSKKKTLYEMFSKKENIVWDVFKKENTSHLLLQSPSPSVPSNLVLRSNNTLFPPNRFL